MKPKEIFCIEYEILKEFAKANLIDESTIVSTLKNIRDNEDIISFYFRNNLVSERKLCRMIETIGSYQKNCSDFKKNILSGYLNDFLPFLLENHLRLGNLRCFSALIKNLPINYEKIDILFLLAENITDLENNLEMLNDNQNVELDLLKKCIEYLLRKDLCNHKSRNTLDILLMNIDSSPTEFQESVLKLILKKSLKSQILAYYHEVTNNKSLLNNHKRKILVQALLDPEVRYYRKSIENLEDKKLLMVHKIGLKEHLSLKTCDIQIPEKSDKSDEIKSHIKFHIEFIESYKKFVKNTLFDSNLIDEILSYKYEKGFNISKKDLLKPINKNKQK